MEPVIKWSGSKRSQAQEIIKRFEQFDCYYEPLSPKGGVYWHYELDVSEYCVPRNYYAYRVNGTWIRSSVPSGYRACKPEIEGEEMWNRESTLEYTYFKIYKCESYEWTLVGNNFSRSKKK